MAKDKSFDFRMQGMVYALKKAKEEGVEALERDIKKRGILRADIVYKESQIDKFWEQLSENVYTNMLTCTLWTLHELFGFGRKRLVDFKVAFDKAVMDVTDLDYIGEHYVTLADYAVELNKKYDMNINADVAAACGDIADDANENYKNKLFWEHIDKVLRAGGFEDAADYLKNAEGE